MCRILIPFDLLAALQCGQQNACHVALEAMRHQTAAVAALRSVTIPAAPAGMLGRVTSWPRRVHRGRRSPPPRRNNPLAAPAPPACTGPEPESLQGRVTRLQQHSGESQLDSPQDLVLASHYADGIREGVLVTVPFGCRSPSPRPPRVAFPHLSDSSDPEPGLVPRMLYCLLECA